MVKNLPFNTGDIRDASSTPGSGRFPGGGHDNPLQYSCLENLMDRGAWQATVHGVTKSQRQLSTQHRHMRARTHTHTHHHSFPSGFSLFQQGLISPGVPAPYPELRKRMKAENKQKYTAHSGSKGPARFLPRSPGPPPTPLVPRAPTELSAQHTQLCDKGPTLDVLLTGQEIP